LNAADRTAAIESRTTTGSLDLSRGPVEILDIRAPLDRHHLNHSSFSATGSPTATLVRSQPVAMPSARSPSPSFSRAVALAGSTRSTPSSIVRPETAAAATLAVVVAAYSAWLARATAELSYNIQVNQYLDSVLLEIATQEAARAYIWDPNLTKFVDDNGPAHALTQSVISALSIAVDAAERPPKFSKTPPDWDSYVQYVFTNSPAVRHEINARAGWWPVLHIRLLAYKPATPVSEVIGTERAHRSVAAWRPWRH
jgi:hypothetical protein